MNDASDVMAGDASSADDRSSEPTDKDPDRARVVRSVRIALLLVLYGVYAFFRSEPVDLFGKETLLFLAAVLLAFVALVLVLVTLVRACTWRTVGKVTLTTVVGVGVAGITEWKSHDIHWARSSGAITRAADEGRLPCGKETCRLGHWTGTKVVVLESAALVFVRDAGSECYAGRALLRPARPGIAADEVYEIAYSVIRSRPMLVRPLNDSWWHICAQS